MTLRGNPLVSQVIRWGTAMALTREDVRGIANYACIAMTEDELDEMCVYMNEAVSLLRPITEYDLDGVEPTFHPIGGLANVSAADEPDAHGRSMGIDDALANAASKKGRSFRVPSILGEEAGDV